ncbi:hypothetical protein Mlab_0052 [Methanocorpusculum labreanum Z]|uniref:Archaeal Type IV pilin N-terminal domain-containing protein n=1 Tax=Methanocorpusculum labreanum (strain ATCC 43576 / DSM 4855 / Z) TaxID=410358 RepID=A2SPH4_METLZ|nr:type IV pilin N-terminal domain-containing protein [Methanocorpusculum labreanum]ABN06230.1 hypothetical protein Mlab_0052 [Methanocorpusculum labreanum Z]
MILPGSQKNDAVSPVIGTIFLIALTIVLIGVVGAAMMSYGLPEPAPILGISIGQQGNIITVTHLNGDVLPAGSYKIFIGSVDKTAAFGGNVDFGPGITLSWDSGTEAVDTVSVVYTSDKGVSTLLAEKKIGKAGSGGGGSGSGGGGSGIASFEDTYTIITKVDWQTFLDNVNASISGLSLGHGIVYVDNGEYWVSLDNKRVSKAEAATNPSIQEYMDIYRDNRLVMIDLSKKMYTEDDMDPTDFSKPWKSTPYPTIGSLYEYGGALYMDAIVVSNIIKPSRDPSTADWIQIADVK